MTSIATLFLNDCWIDCHSGSGAVLATNAPPSWICRPYGRIISSRANVTESLSPHWAAAVTTVSLCLLIRPLGPFLLLVTKKALCIVYVEIYSICIYEKAMDFAVFGLKKKITVLFKGSGKLLSECAGCFLSSFMINLLTLTVRQHQKSGITCFDNLNPCTANASAGLSEQVFKGQV